MHGGMKSGSGPAVLTSLNRLTWPEQHGLGFIPCATSVSRLVKKASTVAYGQHPRQPDRLCIQAFCHQNLAGDTDQIAVAPQRW